MLAQKVLAKHSPHVTETVYKWKLNFEQTKVKFEVLVIIIIPGRVGAGGP